MPLSDVPSASLVTWSGRERSRRYANESGAPVGDETTTWFELHGSTPITELPAHWPADYRAVVELCHFQEMSYAEASATLRLPVSDVKSHLYRARQALAKRLGPNP